MIRDLLGMFRAEFKRIFSIQYIVISITLIVLILFLASVTFCKQNGNTEYFYYMFKNMFVGGYLVELIFIPSALYVVLNLCMDLNQKMVYLFASRSNITAYIIAKIVVGFLFAFAVTFIALGIYIFVFSCNMKMVDRDYFSGGTDVYEDVLRENIYVYFVIRVLYLSLEAALYTVIGMLFTTLIPNKHIATASPFLSYLIIDKLTLILQVPERANISAMFDGYIRIKESLGETIGYITLFCVLCGFILGILLYKLLKWRCYGERT